MSGLTHREFPAFFHAVWGVDPFPWQADLLTRLATGEDARRGFAGEPGAWPAVLDLPTGSGKTAALDIALFHLALEAGNGAARRAPVRIAFVVDRRLIVDDAYARAERLASTLAGAITQPAAADAIVLKVAQALGALAGAGQPPLLARRLRGGTPREDDWARTPVQPTILCSTVDQVGSRLLFRGYGLSDSMKPVHAGLLGSDCLILLDEAHLSEPFRQTLEWVQRMRGGDTARAPFGFAVLSATPGQQEKEKFELSGADETHPARARATFEPIAAELKDTAKVILLIGPARAVDRETLAEELAPIRTGRDGARAAMGRPLIIVATQTIEVGVDIDLDGLVTEAAALDALRQRFGRLNRAGRSIAPEAMILAFKDDLGSKADDPVYGDRIKVTWEASRRWQAAPKRSTSASVRSATASARERPSLQRRGKMPPC
jgi:CRISPR-associated endonuclease/helicase Cas3